MVMVVVVRTSFVSVYSWPAWSGSEVMVTASAGSPLASVGSAANAAAGTATRPANTTAPTLTAAVLRTTADDMDEPLLALGETKGLRMPSRVAHSGRGHIRRLTGLVTCMWEIAS